MKINMKNVIQVIIIFIVIMTAIGCGAKSVSHGAHTRLRVEDIPPDPFVERERFALAQTHFVLARDLERRGDNVAATYVYQIAFDFWPRSKFLRDVLVARYTAMGAHDDIVSLFFRDGETVDSLTLEEKRVVTLSLLQTGNGARAIEILESLEEGEITDDEIFALGLLYSAAGNNERALNLFGDSFGGDSPQTLLYGIRLARMNLQERKFEQAVHVLLGLRGMRGINNENAELISLLGSAHLGLGDTATAITSFRAALELDENEDNALRNLGFLFWSMEDFENAIPLYRKMLAQDSRDRQNRNVVLRSLAAMYFATGEFDEALALINELLPHVSVNEQRDLIAYRGSVHLHLGNTDAAEEDLKLALAFDTTVEMSWNGLCAVYIISKDTVKLDDCTARFLHNFPDSDLALSMRGVYYLQVKHNVSAAEVLSRATEVNPDNHFALIHLSFALDNLQRYDEAVDALRKVLTLDPNNSVAKNNLGYMWTEQGVNLDSAKILILQALEDDPDNAAYIDSYAWVLFKLGNVEEALVQINRALELDTSNSSVLYEHLGEILFALRDYQNSLAAFRRSLELDPEPHHAERINARINEILLLNNNNE